MTEKLVEERTGKGLLRVRGEAVGPVAYAIKRYQSMTAGGMPVPGLHRIEGRIELDALPESSRLERNMQVALDLDDGRRLELTLVDSSGEVLAQGHGPGKCGCC